MSGGDLSGIENGLHSYRCKRLQKRSDRFMKGYKIKRFSFFLSNIRPVVSGMPKK